MTCIDKLSITDKLSILDKLKEVHTPYLNAILDFNNLTGADYEGRFIEAMQGVEGMLFKVVSDQTGIDISTLFDWACIHKFGETYMKFVIDGNEVKCHNNEHLLNIFEEL